MIISSFWKWQRKNCQKMILQTVKTMSMLAEHVNKENAAVLNQQIAEGLVELEKITGYQFTTEKPIRTQLQILYDLMGRLFEEEESDALTIFPIYMDIGYTVDKELFAECIQLPFENLMINAPKSYDVILTKSYHDYMAPRNVRAAHDYPFYKGQLEALGRHIERQDCEWKIQQTRNKGDSNEMPLPQEWSDKIKNKKVILYHTSADALMCHGECVLDKLHYVFNVFENNPDIVLWWFPCLLDNPRMPFMKQMSPKLVQDYHRVIDEYRSENWGIYDDTGDMSRAVALADAYYGDESELFELFKETGKCAMIQEYEIVN